MTDEQIKSIKCRFVSHLAMSDFHFSQYVAEDVPFSLRVEVAVPTEEYRHEHPKARCRSCYMMNGHWISKKKLIEKLKEIEI